LLTIYLDEIAFPLLLGRYIFKNEDGSQGVLYLVTSDLSLSTHSLLELYQKRWKIEEYHKSLKSNASFSKSPTKRPNTQSNHSNHFFASLVAFVKLESLRMSARLNHFALKAKLYQAAIRSAFEQLNNLKTTDLTAAITS